MKLLALIALLAASIHASADADADADAASSSAAAPPPAASSPAADPTPVGALWTSTWDNTTLAPFTQSCASRSTHRAQLFTLASLYPDLETYAPQLKIFYNRQVYPGSWEGVDVHGIERELLKMDVVDLPKAVQEWLEREKTQRHYSVQDNVVFFAPGAIYPIAPLWVEAQEGCEGVFEDLTAYSNEPKDGAVIGKISHAQKGKGEVEFTVEALRVKREEEGRDEL